jgi:hypothetical protein
MPTGTTGKLQATVRAWPPPLAEEPARPPLPPQRRQRRRPVADIAALTAQGYPPGLQPSGSTLRCAQLHPAGQGRFGWPKVPHTPHGERPSSGPAQRVEVAKPNVRHPIRNSTTRRSPRRASIANAHYGNATTQRASSRRGTPTASNRRRPGVPRGAAKSVLGRCLRSARLWHRFGTPFCSTSKSNIICRARGVVKVTPAARRPMRRWIYPGYFAPSQALRCPGAPTHSWCSAFGTFEAVAAVRLCAGGSAGSWEASTPLKNSPVPPRLQPQLVRWLALALRLLSAFVRGRRPDAFPDV